MLTSECTKTNQRIKMGKEKKFLKKVLQNQLYHCCLEEGFHYNLQKTLVFFQYFLIKKRGAEMLHSV